MENWSEEGTIKRVGLLLLLRRTRELSPYVRAKLVFHTIWEVASLSLSHLFNWSDSSGAGKVLRRHIYLLRWMSSVKSCSMCLSCLLPGSYVWYPLFTLWDVICPQAFGISDCHPVPPGQAPFPAGKVIFSMCFISERACCLSPYLCW